MLAQITNLLAQGELSKAHQLLVSMLTREPEHPDAWLKLAELNLRLGNIEKVSNIIKKCTPYCHLARHQLMLAKLAYDCGERDTSSVLLSGIQLSDNALEYDFAANLWLRLNQPTKALKLFKKANKLAPTQSEISFNLATCLKMSGELGAAKTILMQLAQQESVSPNVYLSLAELSSEQDAPALLSKINAAISHQQNNQYLHHAAALCFEHLSNFKRAWHHFSMSKQSAFEQCQFNPEQHRDFCLALTNTRANKRNTLSLPSFTDLEPIFVVGMPRSGTSLVEQLIATQSGCTALGELNDMPTIMNVRSGFYRQTEQALHPLAKLLCNQYATALNAQSNSDSPPRAIDKQPFNIYFVDTLLTLFPKAKIVWVVRNKFDTCVGNFRQAFQINSPFHHYSYDWQHIAKFYDDIEQLGNTWLKRFPHSVMRLSYDELANEPKPVLSELFSFLNIHSEQCALSFYKQHYFSATASKVQLRQPINNKSIGKFNGIYPA